MSISGEFPPHAPPSLWLLGVPPPSSLSVYWGKVYQLSIQTNVMEIFTNSLTGAAFCEQNGPVVIKKNDSGKVFFSSTGSRPLYRSGYISDAAADILAEKLVKDEEGKMPKMSNVIASFLDFAVINYVDDEGNEQSCPTLMPKASGEQLYSDVEW